MSEKQKQPLRDTPAAIKPLLKWVGGKSWFVREYGDDLFSHVKGGCFVEPFLGGAAMALHLGAERMSLGEINTELALTYVSIRDAPDELNDMLRDLESAGLDSETYYQVRELGPENSIETAARLIYLNRMGFNGLYRKNKKGEYNVAYGDGKGKLPTFERIKEVSIALQGADIHPCDFSVTIQWAKDSDVIYADPPYDGTYSGYTPRGFDEKDQRRLASALQSARKRGVDVFAHNSDTPLVRELYSGWADLIEMPELRVINADGEGRGKVPCLLIVAA